MNIGSVKMNDNGQLLGSIAMMNFDAKIGLKPVASSNTRAPKFEIVAMNVARRWVRIGALWEKEARDTGEIYLTGNIDDPALPQKLYIAVFTQADGSYSFAWNRSDPTAKGVASSSGRSPGFDEVDGPQVGYERDYDPPVDEVETVTGGRGRGKKAAASEAELADHPFD